MDASKNIKRKLYNISNKTGKGAIYIYYSFNGQVKKFPTGVRLDAAKWDEANSKPKRGALSSKDSDIVDSLYNNIFNLIFKYQLEFHKLPPINYLEINLNKPEAETNIHTLFNEFIKVRATNNRITESTKEYYAYAAQLLKECDQHFKYNLTLDNFNYDFTEKFIEYSISVKNNAANTINQRFNVFKTFVKYLDKKDIKHSIKPDNWEKLTKDKVDLICLEENEVKDLLAYQPTTPREQRTKDIIVFLSHTGIRQSDLFNIKQEHIINNCIQFTPQKTTRYNIEVRIPISKPVKEILERYNYKLPTYSPKYLSDYIQKLCAKIPSLKKGIIYKGNVVEKHTVLTSHSVGRKTFINLLIQAGVPIPTLMGFTGHTTMDTLINAYLDKHINNLPQFSKVFDL